MHPNGIRSLVPLAPGRLGTRLQAAGDVPGVETLPLLVFTAGLMVKKSASDVSISSGTHGQYSILQTAKLLPGAPQQAVSTQLKAKRGAFPSQEVGPPCFILHPCGHGITSFR